MYIGKRITHKRFAEYMKKEHCNHFSERKKFTEYLKEECKKDPGNFFPVSTEAQLALDFLYDYLLPDYPYLTADPISNNQCNTILVHDILMRYSKEYRKEYKNYCKKKNQ